MKHRDCYGGLAGLGLVSVVLSLTLAPAVSPASIFHDVLAKMHIVKADTPAPSQPGVGHTLPYKGFACCNLHYDGDWISDVNYAELPMIPAGTPIEVVSYGRHRANVLVDGRSMHLGHDYGRDQESLEAWVAKIVVDQDPRRRIGGYPPAVRDAIEQGKVMVGMTREQAIASIGYPLTSENLSLNATLWRVWRSRRGEYHLNFREDGRVASITGDDDVTSQVIYSPRK
jgi:hypothetical protein